MPTKDIMKLQTKGRSYSSDLRFHAANILISPKQFLTNLNLVFFMFRLNSISLRLVHNDLI